MTVTYVVRNIFQSHLRTFFRPHPTAPFKPKCSAGAVFQTFSCKGRAIHIVYQICHLYMFKSTTRLLLRLNSMLWDTLQCMHKLMKFGNFVNFFVPFLISKYILYSYNKNWRSYKVSKIFDWLLLTVKERFVSKNGNIPYSLGTNFMFYT